MPELPEAETIARGLDRILPGRAIAGVEVLRGDVVEGEAAELAAALAGMRFGAVGRRGKNVVMRLEGGGAGSDAGAGAAPAARGAGGRLVVNLGMTGRLVPGDGGGPGPGATHPAIVIGLEGGGSLTYDDVRRFGLVRFLDEAAWRRWSRTLGPEPLGRSFTGRSLAAILAGSRSPVRSLLLDQRKVAGVGNIYAVEALWMARIHPRTRADLVGLDGAARLHRALRRVLRRAVEAGGTTLRNYRAPDGSEGRFVRALHAYGREGRPCPRCRADIERLVFGGRSAFRCPRCQPDPAS